ncbi:MAG TPA: DUF3606 domain-containing protein [Pirellulales bacterium]|nr:DUF3606 domain-containing protein [Pirellulales bacterium]
MSDDRSKRGPQDAQRINLDEDYEVRYWTEELHCSREQLKQTVTKVGVMADDVRRALSAH